MANKPRKPRPAKPRKIDDEEQRNPPATLFPRERIQFKEDSKFPQATDEELNSRYAKGEVRIVTESARYSLVSIRNMLEEKVDGELRYLLDPQYQRRHRWNRKRKSRLIESFLMNVPVPPVFLYERDLARFEVMDGRQRLTALSEFYADKFALTGLEYWPELDKRTYSQLPSKVRDGIDRRYISSIILLKETAVDEEQAAKLKKLVFERLNSGGVRLSSQETRNAIYDGPLNQLCLELSENPHFKKMWGIPNDPVAEEDDDEKTSEPADFTSSGQRMFAQMDDVELVLRFFAYRQLQSYASGLNKISAFLDRFLIEGNRFPPSLLEEYRTMFETTTAFLFEALGTDAFCAISRARARASKIIYDPIMYIANRMDQNQRKRLLKGKQTLRKELETMYKEHEELFAGRRTNTADALQRDKRMNEAFQSALAKIHR